MLYYSEDRKALSVHIYYTWCDIILIFKLHGRTRRTPRALPRSSIHSLKIRMTSRPCNKYEQIMLYYLLSVNLKFNVMQSFFKEVVTPSRAMSGKKSVEDLFVRALEVIFAGFDTFSHIQRRVPK